MGEIDGVTYGAFIVPGLVMLSILTESVSNASFGIYMPRFAGTIYEILSAPISALETVLGYVGAAATKSLILGTIILITARLFVDYHVEHPFWMVSFLVLTSVTFCLFGFIIGVWADGFEKLQIVPLLVITPLTFLGGSFYSINMLPPFWQKVTLFNPVVYLVSGFRWSFFGVALLNLILLYAFIPQWGIEGAAWATCISSFAYNAYKYLYIWIRFRMQPFDRKTFYILACLLSTALVVSFVPVVHGAIWNMLIRSSIIVGVS